MWYFIVPAPESVNRLKQLSLSALQTVVMNSKYKSEEDIETTRGYLEDLTQSLRLELALNVQKKLQDRCFPFNPHVVYGRAKQWPKFMIWRAACFQPDARDMPMMLKHVAFEHFSSYIMQYLSAEWVHNLNNSCLTFAADYAATDKNTPLQFNDYVRHFQIIVPCFTRLTEVTLGARCGDSCLEIIGQTCNSLAKLTLSAGNEATNDGFINFAQKQQENHCLEEINLLCGHSLISLKGLSQIWLLPLAVKKLKCKMVQFEIARDDIQLECPNGSTQLTHLSLDWEVPMNWDGGDLQQTARRVLDCSDILFPSLKSMNWTLPPDDLLISGNSWKTVDCFNQSRNSAISLPNLGMCFPRLASVKLNNVASQQLNSLQGYFKHLERFVYTSHSDDQGSFSFAMFSQILSQVPSLRVIDVIIASEVVNEYTDEALCELFHKCEHVKHLEAIVLSPDDRDKKMPLSNKTVTCILEKCQNMKLLGFLQSWTIDERDNSIFSGKKRYANLDNTQVIDLYGYSAAKYYGI